MHWARITRHTLRSWSSPLSYTSLPFLRITIFSLRRCQAELSTTFSQKETKGEVTGTPLHDNLVTGEHLSTKLKATSQFPLFSMITIQAFLCPLIDNLRLFLSSWSRSAFLSGPSSAFASPSAGGRRIQIVMKTMGLNALRMDENWIQVLPNTNHYAWVASRSATNKGHILMMAATVVCGDLRDERRGKTRL